MISGLQTISIDGISNPLTVNTEIDEENHEITLSCHMIGYPIDDKFSIYNLPRLNWHFVGLDNNCYTAYNCFFIQSELTGSDLYKLKGSYARLLCEFDQNQQFTSVSFSFEGLDELFPLSNYHVHTSQDSRLISSIDTPEEKRIHQIISENLEVDIGPIHEWNLQKPYSLYYKQYNLITFKSKTSLNTNQIVTLLIRLKAYFELCFNSQINFENVVSNSSNGSARLLYDSVLNEMHVLTKKDNIKGDLNKILQGIHGWLVNYDKYKSAIEIFLKSIYNNFIDENDISLWYAQSFETLFQINNDLFNKAIAKIPNKKRKKEKKPNIEEMILVLCDLNLFPDYVLHNLDLIKDAKNYRNLITHHNPENVLSKGIILNSRRIIKTALRQTFILSMDLGYLPDSDLMIIENREETNLCDNDYYKHFLDIKPESFSV